MNSTLTVANNWLQSKSKFKQNLAKSYYKGKKSSRILIFMYVARKSLGLILASITLISATFIHYLYF